MRTRNAIVLAAIVTLIMGIGYALLRERLAAQVYRDRLEDLAGEYEKLRADYNDVVRKTAVTELLVSGGKVSVVVATEAGVLETIPTDLDPSQEIHVDFVVVDGRLWIRRVHDDQTPAARAQVIDPKVAEVAWDEDGKDYGLTVYRPLSEGRWVVQATAGGALTLVRRGDAEPVELVRAPLVREFRTLDEDVQDRLGEIGILEALRAAVSVAS